MENRDTGILVPGSDADKWVRGILGARTEQGYAGLQAAYDLVNKFGPLGGALVLEARRYASTFDAPTPKAQRKVTRRIYDDFIPKHRYYLNAPDYVRDTLRPPFDKLHKAIWEGCYPSLEECAPFEGAAGEEVPDHAPPRNEEHPAQGAVGPGRRPEICFIGWGEIPKDDPLAMSPALQRGFYLANDGGAAHEITVESFEIGRSVRAMSKMLARIEANGRGFALVWLEDYPRSSCQDKWDLLGAMHKASLGTPDPMDMQDYSVTVSAVYRDSTEFWYRSSAEMKFVRSTMSIEFGPITHRVIDSPSQEVADVIQTQDRPASVPPSVGADDSHADLESGGGSQVGDLPILGEATQAASESAKAPQPHARGAVKNTPRRTVDLKSIRERVELADALARELAIIKQETRAYCTAEGLKRKYPKFILWTVIEDSQIKELAEGQTFSPRAYAENLMLAKYGLTSRETTKKYRRRLRQADKAK